MRCNVEKYFKVAVIFVVLSFCVSGVALAKEQIRFGYVNWPGVTVKTHVANQILNYLGYETDMKMLSVPLVFKGLTNKDLDLFLGAWLPTMMSIVEKYFQDGSIVSVAINLDETIYTLAVPKYAWDAGVKSHADLNKFGNRFDRKVIGIEPGNDGNKLVLDMIKNNTYDLGKWELVEGSAEAMMIAVGSAFKQKQWVVWLGWSPHWMNMAYEVEYLKDPLQIWGSEPEIVRTVARAGLDKDKPNVYKLFTQFKVTPTIQNNWIDEYSRKKRKAEDVAKEWIANNLDVVDQWVYGVTSADGRRARDVIREAVK
jgi:glycine betaine/proline transport system substrate-binding protein